VSEGSGPTTVTLTGTNFFTGSLIKAGTAVLTTTILGDNAATAVIPEELLATAGNVPLVVSNPGTGGGDSASLSLLVDAAAPTIAAVVNGATFLDGPVAPGEMVAIFGNGLGPDGTTVAFDTTNAPVIFSSAKQLGVMVPYNVAGKASVSVRVTRASVISAAVVKTVALSSPGLFSAAGSGTGQLAAFNVDETTGALSLNTETSTAVKGGVVVLYATGEGVTSPASTDGQIVTVPTTTPNPALSVQIGGTNGTILYAGGVVGLVSGIMQINVRIPTTITATKSTPVILTINGIASPPGTTIGIK
jgi:uncharacterized protein (TIGR03437 family)